MDWPNPSVWRLIFLIPSNVIKNGFCAWDAKFIAIRYATKSGTFSDPFGLFIIFRYAIAPSCQSTLLSLFASFVITTFELGSSRVYSGYTRLLWARW